VTHRPGAAAAERFLGPQRGGGRPGRPLLHRDGAASENPWGKIHGVGWDYPLVKNGGFMGFNHYKW